MLEEIMAWLTGAEATLTAAEALPDPKEIPSIKTLLDDHRLGGFEMALAWETYAIVSMNNTKYFCLAMKTLIQVYAL